MLPAEAIAVVTGHADVDVVSTDIQSQEPNALWDGVASTLSLLLKTTNVATARRTNSEIIQQSFASAVDPADAAKQVSCPNSGAPVKDIVEELRRYLAALRPVDETLQVDTIDMQAHCDSLDSRLECAADELAKVQDELRDAAAENCALSVELENRGQQLDDALRQQAVLQRCAMALQGEALSSARKQSTSCGQQQIVGKTDECSRPTGVGAVSEHTTPWSSGRPQIVIEQVCMVGSAPGADRLLLPSSQASALPIAEQKERIRGACSMPQQVPLLAQGYAGDGFSGAAPAMAALPRMRASPALALPSSLVLPGHRMSQRFPSQRLPSPQLLPGRSLQVDVPSARTSQRPAAFSIVAEVCPRSTPSPGRSRARSPAGSQPASSPRSSRGREPALTSRSPQRTPTASPVPSQRVRSPLGSPTASPTRSPGSSSRAASLDTKMRLLQVTQVMPPRNAFLHQENSVQASPRPASSARRASSHEPKRQDPDAFGSIQVGRMTSAPVTHSSPSARHISWERPQPSPSRTTMASASVLPTVGLPQASTILMHLPPPASLTLPHARSREMPTVATALAMPSTTVRPRGSSRQKSNEGADAKSQEESSSRRTKEVAIKDRWILTKLEWEACLKKETKEANTQDFAASQNADWRQGEMIKATQMSPTVFPVASPPVPNSSPRICRVPRIGSPSRLLLPAPLAPGFRQLSPGQRQVVGGHPTPSAGSTQLGFPKAAASPHLAVAPGRGGVCRSTAASPAFIRQQHDPHRALSPGTVEGFSNMSRGSPRTLQSTSPEPQTTRLRTVSPRQATCSIAQAGANQSPWRLRLGGPALGRQVPAPLPIWG